MASSDGKASAPRGGGDAEAEAVRPIEFRFQAGLMLRVVVLLLVGALVPAIVFWFRTADLSAATYAEALRDVSALRMALVRVTVLSMAGQLFFAGLLMAGVALLASHKIAGPLVRVERCVRGVGEGNLRQSISFRQGDQDKSLPVAFRALCARLSARVTAAEGVAEDLRALRDELKGHSSAEELPPPERAGIADRIRVQVERLERAAAFEGDGNDSPAQ